MQKYFCTLQDANGKELNEEASADGRDSMDAYIASFEHPENYQTTIYDRCGDPVGMKALGMTEAVWNPGI
jgi:hypothetical protein